MKKLALLGLFVMVAALVVPANAAIILTQTANPSPAPGLDSFTISAVGTAGEIINSFAGINLAGPVHNVQPPFGQPSVHAGQWAADGANGVSLAAWSVYDTHFLFNPATDMAYLIGSLTETNDGTDPAGLGLTNFGWLATVGLGAFHHLLPTDQFTLIPALAGSNVPFLQVVQLAGSFTPLNMVLFDNTGAQAVFSGYVGFPEPSTLLLGCLGLLGVGARRRR